MTRKLWASLAACLVFGTLAIGSGDDESDGDKTESSSKSGKSSDQDYMDCVCEGGSKGVVNLRGCRGTENTEECSKRVCGKYDKKLYQEALRQDGCGK